MLPVASDPYIPAQRFRAPFAGEAVLPGGLSKGGASFFMSKSMTMEDFSPMVIRYHSLLAFVVNL